MRLKTKRFARAKQDLEKPYIETQENLSKPSAREHLVQDPLSSIIPANQQSIDIAKAYRRALPKLLRNSIPTVRDFFLKDIAPISLGVSNGLLDAHDILHHALDEEVDTTQYINKIVNMLHQYQAAYNGSGRQSKLLIPLFLQA